MNSLQQNEDLFERLNDCVMTRTMDGRINFWNRSAEDLYGWRKEEATGKVSHSLLRTDFPKPLEEIESELIRTGRWEGKLVHTTRDGGRVAVQSRWTLDLTEQPGVGPGGPTLPLDLNRQGVLRDNHAPPQLQVSAHPAPAAASATIPSHTSSIVSRA